MIQLKIFRFLQVILLGAISLTLSACAGLDAGPLTDDEDLTSEGFRYYDTSPFLLVYTDSKGGLNSEVLYLPDTTKLRVIRPYNYLASNNATLTFAEGRLSGAKAEVDETAIPSAVIASLEKVATSALKAANGGQTMIPGPSLFRILHTDKGWTLAMDGSPTPINFAP